MTAELKFDDTKYLSIAYGMADFRTIRREGFL